MFFTFTTIKNFLLVYEKVTARITLCIFYS